MTVRSLPKLHGSRGAITPRQQQAYDLFQHYNSVSRVAEAMGISAANVSKHLAAYHRNVMIMNGMTPPTVDELLKGDGMSSSFERARMILASSEGVTTEAFERAKSQPTDDDDLAVDRPEPVNPFATGEKVVKRTKVPVPSRGVLTWMVSYAQDGTPIHEGLWENMLAYRDKLAKRGSAQIMIAPGTYNKGDKNPATNPRHFLSPHELYELTGNDIKKMVFFDHRVEEYLVDHIQEVDGVVDFCAHMDTLPTAVNPLSGLQTHTQGRLGVFPHPKQYLESVARIPGKPYKGNWTTGAVTLPNYIRKKAGMKAEFHHSLGFAIIEVAADGGRWVRLVEADPETGDFYDFDHHVSGGKVSKTESVATISYGDVHHEKLDPVVARRTWGYDTSTGKVRKSWLKKSLLETLRPTHQFFHDISDFAPRNHHNVKNTRFRARMAQQGTDSVEEALKGVADFLEQTKRDWCTSVVVQSNHDNAYQRWLDEADIRQDGLNARLYFWANSIIHQAIAKGEEDPAIFPITLRALNDDLDDILFIDENDSYEVGGIEHSQHGHMGPNGSRGGPGNLYKIAEKLTTGHTHSPFQREGLVTGGVCNLEMGYNKGPTGWAIAHVVGHHDGARQVIFMDRERFAA